MARVLVVGAGVVGLSCAVRLLEHGHRVAVVARDLPLETTSAAAAAWWYPRVGSPRALAWAAATYAELVRVATCEGSGVVLRSGTELLRRPQPPPEWASTIPEAHLTTVGLGLRPGYAAGWSFTSPVVEMPIYLTWLADRVESLGGTITRMALHALPDSAEVTVNATGLGARLLAADPGVTPARGQVVYVDQVGVDRWVLDRTGPTYVVPRSRDVVIGGTDEDGSWDPAPDQEVASALLARATALMPQLSGATVIGHRVGLRPGRSEVRLEALTSSSGSMLVHCYGHGGSGVSISWGCADEVAQLVGPA